MMRRMGRPGLVGTMARTAVVAGTANATMNAMNRRRANKDMAAAQQAQAAAPPPAAQAPAPPPPPAPGAAPADEDDTIAQLQKLAELKAAGVLDDAEFAAAKAKLIASM